MFIENCIFIEPFNSMLENHYFTIMSIIAGLYVGFLAFMYPRIIDFKSKIQNEFVILYKRFSHGCVQGIYLFVISALLTFALFSIVVSIIGQKPHYMYLNVGFSILTILLNLSLAKTIELYLFKPDKLYKQWIAEVDFSKDLAIEENMKDFVGHINELQSVVLYFLNKDILQFDQLEKYIDLIGNQINNYLRYKEDNSDGTWSSNDRNNAYYSYPLDRLVYISQEAIDTNKYDIAILIANKLYAILEYVDNEKHCPFIKSDILAHLKALFIYPIRTNKSIATNSLIEDMVRVYVKLIKSSLKNGVGLISNTRPNYFLFPIIKSVIDARFPVSNLLMLRNLLEKIISPIGAKYMFNDDKELWNIARDYVVALTFDILGYMYYQEQYKDIREYIGNKFNDIFCMLPNNMQMLVNHVFIEKKSIFTISKQEFNEYTEDIEYKCNVVFLVLCLIKQNIDIHNKNITYIKEYNWPKQQKYTAIKFEKSSIKRLSDFNVSDKKALIDVQKNPDLITWLERFLKNDVLFSAFKLAGDRAEYRKFIIKQLDKVSKTIADKSKSMGK